MLVCDIRCDACGCFAGCGDEWLGWQPARARDALKTKGWQTVLVGSKDYCPDCKLWHKLPSKEQKQPED